MKYVIMEYNGKYEERWPIFYTDSEAKAQFMINKLEVENERCMNEIKRIRDIKDISYDEMKRLIDGITNKYTKEDFVADCSYSIFNVKEPELDEKDSKEFAIYELQK